MARTQTYTHDDRNRLISVVDGEGRKVHYGYDAADRVTEFKSPAGKVYGFGYDLNGNRTQVRMPSGAVHRLEHTSLNQPRSYTPPGGVGLRHDYDRDRAATSTTLAGGRIVSSAYDGGGRPTGSEYDEADVVLAYADQTGRPKSLIRTPLQGEDQHIVFSYDGALVTAEQFSGSAQGAASYSHDDDFRVTGSTLTSGAQTVSTTVAYDPDGRPTTIGPSNSLAAVPAARRVGWATTRWSRVSVTTPTAVSADGARASPVRRATTSISASTRLGGSCGEPTRSPASPTSTRTPTTTMANSSASSATANSLSATTTTRTATASSTNLATVLLRLRPMTSRTG